jgi:spore germination cell wall hydrolase CwlJ-like protein
MPRLATKLAKLPPRRVVPQAELPPVEPVKFVDLAPQDARAFNETVPISRGPNPAARPFRFAGSTEDRERATDCLAAGVLYEAGDDAVGERAVAQVVLNRLRHPAFPKTVCGVVFEGSERRTGCQFTFTCDGAMTKWKPSEAGWRRAREIAAMALSGSVYRPVGHSTHYHTDWVVPYWQSSLDKVARVGTHLFFRWTGWWGTPGAFNRQVSGNEPAVAALGAISPAHRSATALAGTEATGVPPVGTVSDVVQPLPTDSNTFVLLLDTRQPPDSYRAVAVAACGERTNCKLLGWTNAKDVATSASPTPEQMDAMDFSYLRDRSFNFERALWNCATFKRNNPRECMRRSAARAEWPGGAPTPAPTPRPAAVDVLPSVRRRGGSPEPAPDARPTGRPTSAIRLPTLSP